MNQRNAKPGDNDMIEFTPITSETHPELFRAMDEAAQEFWAYPPVEWQDAFIDAWLSKGKEPTA